MLDPDGSNQIGNYICDEQQDIPHQRPTRRNARISICLLWPDAIYTLPHANSGYISLILFTQPTGQVIKPF